jgi:pimeloyl-ACP methyl ester carboxylesterase
MTRVERSAVGVLVTLLTVSPHVVHAQATGRATDGSLDNLHHPPGTETAALGALGYVRRHGSGPIHLLLLPGAPFGADVWADFMERNAERYTMWAITQPGYAGTAPPPMPSWENLTETPWLDGVQEALIDLIRDEGMRRPFVVGHHLSGDRQALRLALDHPDLVSGVVVMAGVAGRNVAVVDSAGRRRGARPEEVLPTIRDQWLPTYRTTTAEQWRQGTYSASALSVDSVRGERLFERQISVPIPTQVRYFVELSTRDLRARVAKLTVPLLVIVPRIVGSLGEHFDLGAQRILALPEFEGMSEAEGRAAYVSSRTERFGSEIAALRAVYGAEWLERTTTPPEARIEVVGPSGAFVFDDRPEDTDRILGSWIAKHATEGRAPTDGDPRS